ncbi:UDP-glucose 4-epimerase GalE [Nocardia zapadnayensis]|uniref:UDP-glucose 4-epimerase n=1 Tax=Brevibacterium pityocampae TaxID=506594 RepID=A0ABP8J3F9_9MICO|nr:MULTISPECIES: UDP-glucose 4-epimerase GalE [Actinomycetes]MCK1801887.1 UDP-glucose 4-epimerase GalE [Brevibacterium sp. R8603A2]MCX0277435.1 UDP-glucose 4-epimerase GalE [Nocardia zapadnayensis]
MSTLVTGGAGYIGSHVVRLLEQRGEQVVVVDDLSNGIPARVPNATLVELDLSAADAESRLRAVMEEHAVTAVIHFAAKKQVGESVERPLWYYRNNVEGLANLLAAMESADVTTMVFSSSAAVYGIPDIGIVPEKIDCRPINPYGQTKLVGEWMIDNAARHGLRAIKLRYFNVAGTGWPELADTAVMNLIPIILDRVAMGRAPVVFGDDYPTPDGTCIRDYVHVADLADAHIAALDHIAAGGIAESVFNVGTGRGASVLEVIDAMSSALGRELTPEIAPRRPGDPPQLVADVSAIERELGWRASRGLSAIVESAVPAELRP